MSAASARPRHPGFSLWRYSLGVYRRPAVAKACLALQDACGADVNLLLYCCWMASAGRHLDARDVRSAIAAVDRWQDEVVRPLRRARRALRKDPRGVAADQARRLRRSIAAAELDAEYLELRLLAAAAARRTPSKSAGATRDLAAGNLHRYLAALRVRIGRAPARHLSVLANAS